MKSERGGANPNPSHSPVMLSERFFSTKKGYEGVVFTATGDPIDQPIARLFESAASMLELEVIHLRQEHQYAEASLRERSGSPFSAAAAPALEPNVLRQADRIRGILTADRHPPRTTHPTHDRWLSPPRPVKSSRDAVLQLRVCGACRMSSSSHSRTTAGCCSPFWTASSRLRLDPTCCRRQVCTNLASCEPVIKESYCSAQPRGAPEYVRSA